ncbi:MAG: GlmU family protein [Spirosomataceae bacterium]
MNYLLFDDPIIRPNLLPLTFTRPISELRCGIWRITEKWTDFLQVKPSFLTENYLQAKYPAIFTDDNLYLNGAVCPTLALVEAVKKLQFGEVLFYQEHVVAYRAGKCALTNLLDEATHAKVLHWEESLTVIRQLPDIFVYNGEQISADFQRITAGRSSQPITDRFTACYNESQIFVEEGADIKNASLNATGGPIYIGRNAQIMEGALIQGPFAILDHSVVSLGGKMRPNTSIGPYCKVGGELGGSVIIGYSNKGHEGYMGNAVIGEWCNWGADTNNSNLKNDYGTVKIWNYARQQYIDTGRQFVGLFMGDHSKTGINTMFNTGTVVGVSVNVFGGGLPPKHIQSFSWGGADTRFEVYKFEKAMQVARNTMERRNIVLDETEARILKHVFDLTYPM